MNRATPTGARIGHPSAVGSGGGRGATLAPVGRLGSELPTHTASGLQLLFPSARTYGSTLAASSRTVADLRRAAPRAAPAAPRSAGRPGRPGRFTRLTPTVLDMVQRVEADQRARQLHHVTEVAGVGRFRSEAALAMHAGAAPLECSSGAWQRHRLSRIGNRQRNAALHRIAVTQLRVHPPAQAYLTRLQATGKSKGEALRILKRRLIRAIFDLLHADLDQTRLDQPAAPLPAQTPAA